MILVSLGLALSFAPPAEAKTKEAPSTSMTISVYKLGPMGRKGDRLSSAEQPKAGDILIYRGSYRNDTKQVMRNFVATVPLPPGLIYVAYSATPPLLRASKDGINFFLITAPPKDAPVSSWRSFQWAPRDAAPLSEFTVELQVRVLGPSGE